MTPEQQAMLDKLQKVLDPTTFDQVRAILIALWAGRFAAAGYAEYVERLLLEWAARQGTWMWLTIKDALGLTGETAAADAGGGAAAAIGLSLLPLLLLLTGGLVLPGLKLGTPGWDWGGWFRDPCEDRFSEISDEFANYTGDRGSFPTGATRKSTMNLLGEASALINECDKFLIKCPDSKRAQAIRQIRANAEKGRDEYLDWLATH